MPERSLYTNLDPLSGPEGVLEPRDLFMGLDPGKSGGIAVVDSEGGGAQAWKMPETPHDLWALVCELEPRVRWATIEKVGGMPTDGRASLAKFMWQTGTLHMALVAAQIPFAVIAPRRWQKAMRCMTGGDKNVSKRRAQELWPALKITHATADALLLAEYGRLYRHRTSTAPGIEIRHL